MPIIDSLLPEYDHEMSVTRKLLERVPEQDFTWKPHEKSSSLGALAAHLANIPTWVDWTLDKDFFDMDALPADARPGLPAGRAQVLERFDKNVSSARAKMASKTDGELLTPWTFKAGGRVVFTMPKVAVLRSFVMNHTIHHRGQLSVYLRLRDVPLPMMYGPTADEAM
ncbi:MAG: DinB family protein [Vicinamibacterales bacterium]